MKKQKRVTVPARIMKFLQIQARLGGFMLAPIVNPLCTPFSLTKCERPFFLNIFSRKCERILVDS